MNTVATLVAQATVLAETLDQDDRKTLIDNALPIAGLFVLVLGIAMFFLWKSLNKQMKRIDPDLPAGPDGREQALDRALTQEAVERGQTPDDTVGK